MQFKLRQPCKHCPFRSDITPYLRAERAREIAHTIRDGGTFPCHKTTEENHDGNLEATSNSLACAGALITLENNNEAPQDVRIAERLGIYDVSLLKTDSPVYPSLTEWVEAHSPPTELEHCGVVGPDCEDPAGFAYGGGAYGNDDEPTCSLDNDCQYCGSLMCGACSSDEDHCCVICAEES